MSRFPYHKHYHSDFLRGVSLLSNEQVGAYIRLIDMVYEASGPIPDDDVTLAHQMNCSVRRWRRLKGELIDAGKIVVAGGLISNPRAIVELDRADRLHERQSDGGKRGAATRKQSTAKRPINARSSASRTSDQVPHKSPNSETNINENKERRLSKPCFSPQPPESRTRKSLLLQPKAPGSARPPASLSGGGRARSPPKERSIEEQVAALRAFAEEEAMGSEVIDLAATRA